MPTNPTPPAAAITLSMPELATLLIREAKLTSGWYEASLTFGVSIGVFHAPLEAGHFPGAVTLVKAVSLMPSTEQSPIGVDAAKVATPSAKLPPAKAPGKAARKTSTSRRP